MKIALAQINPIVGDIVGNTRLIADAIHRAADQNAQLVVFGELAVIGYPPRDLLLKPAAIERCVAAIEQLAAECTDIAAIIGYPCPATGDVGRSLYNAAALCHHGKIAHRYVKSLLPTYDVFDERRYFEPARHLPGQETLPELHGHKIGVSICEDLWNDADFLGRLLYHHDPVQHLVDCGADIIVNASASPFVMGKQDVRLRLFSKIAKRAARPVLYCNQVGGNDELIFDGHSCAFDNQGNLVAYGKGFEEDLVMVELSDAKPVQIKLPGAELPGAKLPGAADTVADAYHALVLGLRDYCRKCGFKSIVLGLSGGIDSALTCAIAVAALGRENVRGVAMPSRYSSGDSVSDAADLAERLDIKFHTVAIKDAHDAFEKMLTPAFEGLEPDTTEENIQARVRGIILMAMSNKFGSLLVTTGNKSELAVGYCTLYGDMAGGLAVLSDVPKTMVWKMARWINESPDSPLRLQYHGPVIPENSISKPPSAELKPDQVDQDTLPEYEILDQIIERYVELEHSARKIIDETGFDPETVQRIVRLIDLNEYKRKQAAPGLKITGRAFGVGRRMPIAQRYDNK